MISSDPVPEATASAADKIYLTASSLERGRSSVWVA
jgi:hypothetical protein